jgi:hypothetical protein
MKKITLSILFVFIAIVSFGQIILNPGFETWVNNTETNTTFLSAQHWIGSDVFATYANEAFGNSTYSVHSVSQTTGHSGNYAVQMTVGTSNAGDTVSGVIFYTDSVSTLFSNIFTGDPALGHSYAARPANLTGYYKWNRVGNDSATVIVAMTKWNATTHTRDTVVDMENYFITTNASSWTMFTVPLTYILNVYPDTVFMAIGIANTVMPEHPGSIFTVDDLSFTGNVAIGIHEEENNQQSVTVFPNPFGEQATLSISNVQLTKGSIEIYDMLGNKVRVMENLSGNNFIINREGLPAGIYFYNVINDGVMVGSGKISVE